MNFTLAAEPGKVSLHLSHFWNAEKNLWDAEQNLFPGNDRAL